MDIRLSLNPEPKEGGEAKHWAVFSDVALAMLLVFLLFILAQFLQYERIFVLDEIRQRKAILQAEIMALDSLPANVGLEVIDEDELNQRIRISGVVFVECRDDLSADGIRAMSMLGEVLNRHAGYFEAVQVEGHADRRSPTGPACVDERIDDNWQLSARRATEVVRLFSTGSVLPNRVLSSVGRGEYLPLSTPSDTAAVDLARDRRIELILRYTDDGILEGTSGE